MEKNIMATPHNPTRLLQLLEICTWKSKCALSYSGFSTLSSNIIDCIIKGNKNPKLPEIAQKYLSDLLADINKAIEEGEDIGRNAEYISSILNYIKIKNWGSFQEKLGAIESLIDFSKIDFSEYSETNITVVVQATRLNEVKEIFHFPEKSISIPIIYEVINIEEGTSILSQLKSIAAKKILLIWCVDDTTNDLLKSAEYTNELKDLFECGQIVPIRLGQTLSEENLRLNFIDKKHDISGQHGLLMALSALVENLKERTDNSPKKGNNIGPKTQIGTLNNSGNIFSGDNQIIKGENINFGSFTQNIHKKDNKDGNEN
ncbi:MAG: hypothetical protein GQ574_27295 [Crocinitomix sp.]|nr:hypothetical protein [Crocinitomix sp.]